MNCDNCGSGLPPNSPVCAHCGTAHALDLRVFASHTISDRASRRPCPNGCGPLHDVRVSAGQTLFVQHCPHCLGMLVDPDTLGRILNRIRSQTDSSNPERLRELLAHKLTPQPPVKRLCPCCGNGLTSRLFHSQLALRIDQCPEHGTWFDNGEFALLAEWSEAGGARHASRQAGVLLPIPELPTHAVTLSASGGAKGNASPEDEDEIPIPSFQNIANIMSGAPLGNFGTSIEFENPDRYERD